MTFYCADCKQTFDENEIGYSRECIGSFWGEDVWVKEDACPYCGSIDIWDNDDDDDEEEEDEDDEWSVLGDRL